MSSGTVDQRWRRADRPAEERAEHCCPAMTFDEQVAVALGDFDAVAHLGIPPLRSTDGPNGIRDIRGRAGFEVGARTPVGS